MEYWQSWHIQRVPKADHNVTWVLTYFSLKNYFSGIVLYKEIGDFNIIVLHLYISTNHHFDFTPYV